LCYCVCFSFKRSAHHRALHSFPTRRSSDLTDRSAFGWALSAALVGFGLGSWGGGWLGDAVGRRWSLALATVVFSLATVGASTARSEEHTSELQSRENLVCRLLLEKKKDKE